MSTGIGMQLTEQQQTDLEKMVNEHGFRTVLDCLASIAEGKIEMSRWYAHVAAVIDNARDAMMYPSQAQESK